MFDVILKGGHIVDGSGNPWYYGGIGIRGDRIAAIGKLDGADARRVIDASDRAVCPGFSPDFLLFPMLLTSSDAQLGRRC